MKVGIIIKFPNNTCDFFFFFFGPFFSCLCVFVRNYWTRRTVNSRKYRLKHQKSKLWVRKGSYIIYIERQYLLNWVTIQALISSLICTNGILIMKKDRLIHNSMHEFNAQQEQGKIPNSYVRKKAITEKWLFFN